MLPQFVFDRTRRSVSATDRVTLPEVPFWEVTSAFACPNAREAQPRPPKTQSHLFSTSISRIIIALPKIIDVFARASVNIMPGRNTFLAGQQALRAEGTYQWLSSFEASFSDSGIHRSLRL
jgi:hypothetical protein